MHVVISVVIDYHVYDDVRKATEVACDMCELEILRAVEQLVLHSLLSDETSAIKCHKTETEFRGKLLR